MLIAMKNNVPGGSINEQPIEQAQCTIFNSQNLATHKNTKKNALLDVTRILLQTSSEMAILLLYTGKYKRAKICISYSDWIHHTSKAFCLLTEKNLDKTVSHICK